MATPEKLALGRSCGWLEKAARLSAGYQWTRCVSTYAGQARSSREQKWNCGVQIFQWNRLQLGPGRSLMTCCAESVRECSGWLSNGTQRESADLRLRGLWRAVREMEWPVSRLQRLEHIGGALAIARSGPTFGPRGVAAPAGDTRFSSGWTGLANSNRPV